MLLETINRVFKFEPVRAIVWTLVIIGLVLEAIGVLEVGTVTGIATALVLLGAGEATRASVFSPATAEVLLAHQDLKAGTVQAGPVVDE